MKNDDEEYIERENLWDEAWPSTEREGGKHPADEPDVTDEETPYPGVVGTSDALESVRDAEPYMAPTDPPVLAGGEEGIHIGTGFGVSTEDELYDEPRPRGDEDIRERAFHVLREDSLTSNLPLDVDVDQGFVRLRGRVASLEDAEHAIWVLGEIPGVVDVIDETTLDPNLTS